MLKTAGESGKVVHEKSQSSVNLCGIVQDLIALSVPIVFLIDCARRIGSSPHISRRSQLRNVSLLRLQSRI